MKISINWSRENLAWAGGFLEGEGCISRQITTARSKRYSYWVLRASSTDLDTLEKLQRILGVGSIYKQKISKSKTPRKRAWQWTVYRQPEVYAILIAIFTFSVQGDGLGPKKRLLKCELAGRGDKVDE